MRHMLRPHRETIYLTPYFRKKYESQAKQNISDLLFNYITRIDHIENG